MLTNDQMKAGRFLAWHKARKACAAIVDHLATGGTVCVTTSLRQTCYQKKHAGMFRATRGGLFVQSGKRWEHIGFCRITLH